MAKYKCVWTEHVKCSATVEAASDDEAVEKCYDIDNGVIPGTIRREAEGTSDWSVEEADA